MRSAPPMSICAAVISVPARPDFRPPFCDIPPRRRNRRERIPGNDRDRACCKCRRIFGKFPHIGGIFALHNHCRVPWRQRLSDKWLRNPYRCECNRPSFLDCLLANMQLNSDRRQRRRCNKLRYSWHKDDVT